MKQLLTLVAVAIIGLLAWYLRGSSDATIIDAKNAQIAALNDAGQSKDKLLIQTSGEVSDRDETIKSLQDKIKLDVDLLAKDQAQLDADKVAYQRLQDGDQTLLSSLKSDNDAAIQELKSQIQDKDNQIAEINEKLVQTIADYEGRLTAVRGQIASMPNDGTKIYPKDNGFELQDVGTGFFSYRYFGESIRNPTHVEMPPSEPNKTPWTFTKDAGVAANGSGFYVTNATNGDSDGKTSNLGQAAFLEFKDSAVSQTIDLPAGTFTVTFSYEARRDYTPNEVTVSLGGTIVFKGAPSAVDRFTEVTTDPVTLCAGKQELKIVALGDGVDTNFPCTFIDDVRINVLGSHQHSAKKPPIKTTALNPGAGAQNFPGN